MAPVESKIAWTPAVVEVSPAVHFDEADVVVEAAALSSMAAGLPRRLFSYGIAIAVAAIATVVKKLSFMVLTVGIDVR
jgi:hypothetical protein